MTDIPQKLRKDIKERVKEIIRNMPPFSEVIEVEGIDLSPYRLETPVRLDKDGPFVYYKIQDGSKFILGDGMIYFTYERRRDVGNPNQTLEPAIYFSRSV